MELWFWGVFCPIDEGWARWDGTPVLPFLFLIIPFQSLNALTSLIARLQPGSLIHGLTLALSNTPAATQCTSLAVTAWESITCWEIIVLQV